MELTFKEQELRDYIIKTEHSTDCAASVFWAMNPDTIQPFMMEHGMYDANEKSESKKFEMLERVLNSIEKEKKGPSAYDEIIRYETDYIDSIVTEWTKGNRDEAGKSLYSLCGSYGLKPEENDAKRLFTYISNRIESELESNGWVIIDRYPEYKIKEDGTVMRMKDKKVLPIENNKVKLRKDGKYVNENINELVAEAFYKEENEIDKVLSEFEVSSDV